MSRLVAHDPASCHDNRGKNGANRASRKHCEAPKRAQGQRKDRARTMQGRHFQENRLHIADFALLLRERFGRTNQEAGEA
jgi:hypothetical protein